jgi:hypothetical protein
MAAGRCVLMKAARTSLDKSLGLLLGQVDEEVTSTVPDLRLCVWLGQVPERLLVSLFSDLVVPQLHAERGQSRLGCAREEPG